MTDAMQKAILKACIAALENKDSDYIVAKELGLTEEEMIVFYDRCVDAFDDNKSFPDYS